MTMTLLPGMDGPAQAGGTATEVVKEATEPARLRRPDRAQVVLEPVCLEERLPADHAARLIWRVVERLDLSRFYEAIAARDSEPGRAATDPKVLVALWLYAAADVESRAIVGVEVVNTPADQNQSQPMREQVERGTGGKVKEHLVDQGYVDMDMIEHAHPAGVVLYAPLPLGKDGHPVTSSRWDTSGTTAWRERMQTESAKAVY